MDSLLPAGDYPIEARLSWGGARVRCSRRDRLALRLFTFGEDEPHLFKLLKLAIARSAEKPPVFVDVGANLGTLSIRLSRYLGCESICFEPQPALAKLLAENAAANGVADEVRIHETALAEHAGETAFFINPDHLGEASIREIANSQKITVPVRRLDAVMAAEDWKRTAIVKVDVEGFEKEVFLGASGLFAVHRPPIVFEVNQGALAERKVAARDVADALRAGGYTEFHALEEYLYPPQNGVHEIANILAVTSEHAALVEAYGFRRDAGVTDKGFGLGKPLEV
jgi:FkbM family methyltransferase